LQALILSALDPKRSNCPARHAPLLSRWIKARGPSFPAVTFGSKRRGSL